jgi:YbbR domain-containing protein
LYVSLSSSFSIFISVPLEIKTNEDQAIVNNLPHHLTVEIKGKGWDLVKAKYLGKIEMCLLDISRFEFGTEQIDYPYTKLEQNLVAMEKFEVKSISPERISIQLGKVTKEDRPLKSNIQISPRMGFTLVGDVSLTPDKVMVKGFKSKMDSLIDIPTNPLIINDAYLDLTGNIPLTDSILQDYRINPTSVKYNAEIQLRSDITFRHIPVRIKAGVLPTGHVIQPKYITVVVYGGVEELAKLLPSNIGAFVDYDKIINDKTGIIIPEIDLPANIKLLKTEPSHIYHYKYRDNLQL